MNRFAKAFVTVGILVATIVGANTAKAVGTTPTVVSVSSTSANGTYEVGDTVNITVTFSESVNVTGSPTITLETGPTDRTIFCHCSPTNTLTVSFAYKVQVGDRSTDLDYQGTTPILFNSDGGIVATSGGASANLTFPVPGASGSLSASKSIVIDGSGEAEQWQNPHAAVRGLHSLTIQEDLRENVSGLWASDDWSLCSFTVMNASLLGGTATLKTAVAHSFSVGEQIVVSGMSNSNFNGTFNVSTSASSAPYLTFTYSVAGSPADVPSAPVSAGRVSRDCSSRSLWYRSVLQPCANAGDVDCIESVIASSNSAQSQTGTFNRSYPARGATDFVSSTSGIHSGGPSSLYSFTSFPHAFGNDYAVTVSLKGTRTAGGQFSSPSFFASITPVSIATTEWDARYNAPGGDGYSMDGGWGGIAKDRDDGYRCILWDNVESPTDADTRITFGDGNGDVSTCAKKHAFPAGIKFELKVRLSQTPAGWFHGRMSDPSIEISTVSGVTSLSVEAGAVNVPVIGASSAYSNLPDEVKNWFQANCSAQYQGCGTRFGNQNWTDPLIRNAESSPDPYSAGSFSQLSMWKDFFADSASAVPSNWNVRTLASAEMSGASSCISGSVGLTGIVTTNSALYSQGPPVYNSSTGTLNYQVASPHFLNDGTTEFFGDYNLLVREDVAQCLYGFTGTEITSSLSVVDTNGAAKQATTSLARENGFFKFSASGFTFSAPTIKARLQGVQAASAPAAEAKSPSVTVPAVTVPAVTVPAVTIPAVTVPAITPKIGAPVAIATPPAAKVAANLGVAVEGAVVRTAIKVPAIAKGVGIKSYQVVLRSSSGKIVAMQTIVQPVAGKVVPSKLTAPSSGSYKIEIVATTSKGLKLPKWTSPSIKLKK